MSELSRDRQLDVELSAIMGRDRFTQDPQPVIDELRAVSGRHVDVLASTVGQWIGFYGSKDTQPLVDALLAAFADLDLAPGIALGAERRNRPTHSTSGYAR